MELSNVMNLTKSNSTISAAKSPHNHSKSPTLLMSLTGNASGLQSTTAAMPFLALPTNPILIIPYSLIHTASFITGPL